jgi:hypothetical protein
MDKNYLKLSDKELFYGAMILNLDRLVNVVYDFPMVTQRLAAELDDVKRSFHKKKLLKENSKGQITLDNDLSACVTFCAKPDSCVIVEEDGFRATLYGRAGSYMLLESVGEGERAARLFGDRQSANSYIENRLSGTPTKEVVANGAA